ncbi:hypothetical protein K3495_g14152 [Podosphaera aphanis]|nr:hypothetical protein K3495_g14152 [Podosphaera aphanis]
MQALSRLTQSTWGATFHKAKMLYNTIVRPALTYGSPVWAETGTTGEIPQRIVKPLQSIQRKYLQTITGAYKSTSTRVLEQETSILPMGIYLKNRRVQHAGLTRNSPVQGTIEKTCRMIRQVTRGGVNNRTLSKEKDRVEWSRICSGEESIKGQKEMGKTAAFQEWANSWPQRTQYLTREYRATADRSFVAMMNNPEDLGRITKWILDQKWLEQFRLAGEVERLVLERGERRQLT